MPGSSSEADAPLFSPSRDRVKQTNLSAFSAALETAWGVSFPDYAALHDFSIGEMEKFWRSLWLWDAIWV